jgi:hypothetical protein
MLPNTLRTVLLALICLFGLTAQASTKRSYTAVVDFKKAQPCPATGATKGPCKGYVIDHIAPLACGGVDRPSNMQWQSIAEAKAKDKWERQGCSKGQKKD